MAKATLDGPEAVRALGPNVLFTWLGKIFYGLIHRELFLAFDQRDRAQGSIATPELIEAFSVHHLFLQSVRRPMRFEGFPASLLVCETTESKDGRHGWDFRDNLPNLFISVRVGRTGIMGVLQDGGVQKEIGGELNQFNFPLHPVQFAELAAMVCYKSMLSTCGPKYLIAEGQPVTVIQIPPGGMGGEVRFRDWNWRAYATLLHHFTWQITGLGAEALYDKETGAVMTWLRKPDGSVAGTMPFRMS